MPALVNGTDTAAPADAVTQNGDPLIVPVVTVAETFTITSLLVTIPHGKVELQTT